VRHDVILVGRSEHMQAVRLHGLRITGKTALIAKPRTALRAPRDARPELILVTTKAYDTAAAMRRLKPFADRATFLTLQNGLDNPDVIARTARRVLAGTTAHGVTFVAPGNIRHAGVGERSAHELLRPAQALLLEVGPLLEEIPKPLLLDLVRPLRPYEALDGYPHQEIAKRRRVEDRGVVEDGETRPRQVDRHPGRE